MPRLDPLELAARPTDAPQSVVLDVVAELHREDHAEAQRQEGQNRPCAAHPVEKPVPEGGFGGVAPERVRVVPHRQVTARQPVALDPPGFGEVARHLPRKVAPEALPPGCGPDVPGRAHEGVMDVDVLRGVVRVRDGGQQKLPEPAFPCAEPVDHLVSDDEDRLRRGGQHQRHQRDLPSGQMADDEYLPEREHERHRPQHRPRPHGQLVPEQLAVGRPFRVHVPLVRAERRFEDAREPEEDERARNPPAAVDCGIGHERKDREGKKVREGVSQRRLDHVRSSGRSGDRAAGFYRIFHHAAPPGGRAEHVTGRRPLLRVRRPR